MANATRAEKVVETILAGKTVATVPLGRLGIANGSPLIATRGIIHLDWGPAFSSPFPPGSSHVSLPHPLSHFFCAQSHPRLQYCPLCHCTLLLFHWCLALLTAQSMDFGVMKSDNPKDVL